MNGEATVQLPEQMSTHAPQVDWLYYFLYWMSVAFFVAITGAALYFVYKYRRRPGVKAAPPSHNTALEIAWTFAPLILLVYLFHQGFRGYMHLRVAPANAMEIRVRAYQWGWEFTYPNGAVEPGELHVPVHRPVRLVMSSSDVIHSFFVPSFRMKQDVVPGQYQTLWFEATHEGTTDLFCAEYCGAPEGGGQPGGYGHSTMLGHVVVESDQAYSHHTEALFRMPDRFAAPGGGGEPAWGAQLYHDFNCFTCHTNDGNAGQGPTWRGMWGRHETFTDGTSLDVDANYIRESILQPQARIVRGFGPVMPRASLRDPQINAIIAYIRSLH
jgi:cytochrome c oxidase subunit 2